MSVQILAVESSQVPLVWEKLEPMITPALEHAHNQTTASDIRASIEAGEMGCLVAIDGHQLLAVQTAEVVVEKDGYRFMNLVTTAGHQLDKWQDAMSDALDQLARELHCKEIRTRGRLGWLRQLKRNGYAPMYFVATKEVI